MSATRLNALATQPRTGCRLDRVAVIDMDNKPRRHRDAWAVAAARLVAAALVAACSAAAAPTGAPSVSVTFLSSQTAIPVSTLKTSSTAVATPLTRSSAPSPLRPPSAAPSSLSIVGSWQRTQSCAGELAAFDAADLLDKAKEWVSDNWLPPRATPDGQKYCAGAVGPRPHSHFFTVGGDFGSRDENGNQVDDGHYVVLDSNTLSFPDPGPSRVTEGVVGKPQRVRIKDDIVAVVDHAEFSRPRLRLLGRSRGRLLGQRQYSDVRRSITG